MVSQGASGPTLRRHCSPSMTGRQKRPNPASGERTMGGGPTRWHIGRYREFLGSSCLEPDAWECRWVGSLDELREHSLEWQPLTLLACGPLVVDGYDINDLYDQRV